MNGLFKITNSIDKSKFEKIHDHSLKVIEQTGMRFFSDIILTSLEKKGAKIDWSKNIACIPSKLVDKMLFELKEEIKKGRKQIILNGGVTTKTDGKIACKMGAPSLTIYDWDNQIKRDATEADSMNAIRVGQAVPEISMVGLAVFAKEVDGKVADPVFRPILDAMLLAKNTSKVGNSEVNSEKQLKYLIEMGTVVRGSFEEYNKNPCFITAKESISPLTLDKNACEVLVALAKSGLPANIIPMPIIGASTPVSVIGSMILVNAEILATMTAIRAVVPDANVAGGSIASVMDMATGEIKFNTIDAIKFDAAMSQLHDEMYGLDYGYGIYTGDSRFLGPEVVHEWLMKILCSAFLKKFDYTVGQYNQGTTYSPELALIEIDVVKSLHLLLEDIVNDDLGLVLDTINKVGPGGSFLAEEHTLQNFKKVWRSEILQEIVDRKNDKKIKGMFDLAGEKYKDMLKNTEHYRLPDDKEKEIDILVSKAYKDIIG